MASEQQPQQAAGQQTTQQGGEKEDYGDKAFGFIAKKSGHSIDRNTSEKITDGARSAFEKITG